MSRTIAFDTHQRLELLQKFLNHFLSGDAGLPNRMILDVGGGSGLLASRMGETARVVTVDRDPAGVAGHVRGSGLELPFRSGAFSCVVASDMLEHIPPDSRTTLLREVCRVSSGWVLVNGPFGSAETEQAEASVNRIWKTVRGRSNSWLDEHWENGLPDLAGTRRELAREGFSTVVVPNGSLFSWFLLKSMEMLLYALPDMVCEFDQVNDLYLRFWSDRDHRRPTYRHLVAAHRDQEQVERLMQNPPARAGLEFFGPHTAVPSSSADEAQRIRATGTLFDHLAGLLQGKFSGGDASVDWAYLDRLERIVADFEKRSAQREEEIAALRERLDRYESSRAVRLWRRFRWKRGS